MSTSIAGVHTDSIHIAAVTNAELAAAYSEVDEVDDQRILALEAPGNCQLIIVEGDLEAFARDVYQAVFGIPPATEETPHSE